MSSICVFGGTTYTRLGATRTPSVASRTGSGVWPARSDGQRTCVVGREMLDEDDREVGIAWQPFEKLRERLESSSRCADADDAEVGRRPGSVARGRTAAVGVFGRARGRLAMRVVRRALSVTMAASTWRKSSLCGG